MSLPKGWKVEKLGDVCEIDRGGSPRPIKNYLTTSDDSYNWIKIADATASSMYIYETKQKIKKEGLKKSRLVEVDDLILSNSMSFGKPYIMKTTGCIHDGWLRIKPIAKYKINNIFLYHLFCSPNLYTQFNNLAYGSTVRNLNIGLVSSVSIPIPPLAEQKKIVAILDKAFAAIDEAKANTEQNIVNAKEIFQSRLDEIFSNPKSTWKVEKLGDVCVNTKNIKWENTENNYKYIDLSSVSRNSLEITETKIINRNNSPSRAKIKVQTNDVLFGTTRPLLKRVTIINREYNDSICSTGFSVLRANSKEIFPKLIYFFLQSSIFINRMELLQRGTSYPAVSKNDVQETPIPIPPLAEQKKIVAELDKLRAATDQMVENYEQKLEDLEELRKSMLERAFLGELT